MLLNYYETRSGISNEPTKQKDVVFIDYDGTEVFSCSKEELEHTRLPDNPSHPGLIAQGWNWTLSQIIKQLEECPGAPVYVGQFYITASGATEVDIILTNGRKKPSITLQNEFSDTTIDWGDGNSTYRSATASTFTVTHEYASGGAYTIKIYAQSIKLRGNNIKGFINGEGDNNRDDVYGNCVQNIRSGNMLEYTYNALTKFSSLKTITIAKDTTATNKTVTGDYSYSLQSITFNTNCIFCLNNSYNIKNISLPYGLTSISIPRIFRSCYLLEYITIPITVNSISDASQMFEYCCSLKKIVFPNGITQFDTCGFLECYSLKSIIFLGASPIVGTLYCQNCYVLDTIIFPGGISSLVNNSFSTCDLLEQVILSDELTVINQGAFQGCQVLHNINIPSSVESIGASAFSNCQNLKTVTLAEGLEIIYTQAFANCASLEIFTIPSTVIQINDQAFSGCQNIAEYHVLPTTPPTLGTFVFLYIQPDTIIYVPRGCLTAYQTATNWSEYASYMQEEPA